LGYVSAINSNGRTIWIADAHRDDGKRFVVHADGILTAFLEIEAAICDCGKFVLTSWPDCAKLRVTKRIRIRRRTFPSWVRRLFRTRYSREATPLGQKERNEEP
jgi:hypothetical protein